MNGQPSSNAVPPDDQRAALERIVGSAAFNRSARLCHFLRFVVDTTLAGKAAQLKESVIGTEVYARPHTYDPGQDSIVRTEGRRLRTKLVDYYATEGKDDPVLLYFRLGSYVPHFRRRHAEEPAAEGPHSAGAGIAVAVIPFSDASGSPLAARCASELTEELVYELTHTEGIRVAAASSTPAAPGSVPELARKLAVQIVFEGAVREESGRLRVTSRLVSADGFQIWSQRFEARADSEGLFALTGQLASALVSRIRPQQSIVRRFDATISEAVITRIPVLLEAETLLDQEAPADLERALAKFREIAAALPEFARPLCGIAQAFCELALRGAGPTATLVAEAREPAARALQLDKDMIQAHAVTGWVQTLEWQWDEAERRFRTAIDLGSDVGTHRQFGLHLAARRRFDEAFHHLQKAQQADPFSQRQQIACARFFHLAGRGAEAEKHFADGVASGSLPAEAQVLLALIYLDHGQPDEAKRIAATLSQGGELSPPLAASVAEVLARGGDLDAARALEREAGLLSAASPLGHFRRALLLAALGAGADDVVAQLTAAHQRREPELVWLAAEPRLAPLCEHAGFIAIQRCVFPA